MSAPPDLPADRTPGSAAAALREFDHYTLWFTHAGSQLKDHIYDRSRRCFAAGDAQRDALGTAAAVQSRQEEIRRNLLASLGGLPSSETPLNPRITGTVPGEGFQIEKLIFESRPRHYVTANLYLPLRRPGPVPAVLFLCGHLTAAKADCEYQSVCQTLVRAGLAVLVLDPIGQGERFSYFEVGTGETLIPPGTREHDTAGAQCRFVGDGLARYFLHDAMRGVDYLLTRPEVDAGRIGVTGNSGGGTQTSLMMMADSRIAAAAPGTFLTTRDCYQRTGQAQDAEQIWPGFTRLGYDHEDILLAMAPKPVCVLAVTDDFFPIEGTRRTVTRARRIWELFPGAPPLKLVEDQAAHSYTPVLARAAASFFSRHLLGLDVDLTSFAPEPLPVPGLTCTGRGQVRAEFSDAEFVFDANFVRSAETERARRALPEAERRVRARHWLREQVFLDREAGELNPRVVERARALGLFEVDVAFWWAQPQLAGLGVMIRALGARAHLPVTLAVWDDGIAALSRHADWLTRECNAGRAVFVVNLSGTGPLRPDPINPNPMHEFYGTLHKLSDDLDWLGDSLVALRTYEVLRAAEALIAWPDLDRTGLRLYGHGRMGVHARLAAAVKPSVPCEWGASFRFADFVGNRMYETKDVKSFLLPGVLQYFDTDEL
jgi:hypothetical protein